MSPEWPRKAVMRARRLPWQNARMQRLAHLMTAVAIAGLLVWVGNPPAAETPAERSRAVWESMPQATLRITGVDGETRKLAVRVADNPATRAQGMQRLSADTIREHPIWFVFDPPRRAGWHMNNVELALDILYVDADGRVIGRERMEPGGSGYGLDEPIAGALEVAAGQADRYGLERGARIQTIQQQ